MSVLELSNITKRYATAQVLGPIDLGVREGEFLTLLGPSGCGKTTTLQIIAGLTQPSTGTVSLKGKDITTLPPPYRDMGLVFQSYALFPHRTIAENVAFGLRMRKVPRAEIEKRVREIVELVGLPNVLDRYPHQLSGGQRQRVAVARALVIRPSMLLLDEPLSNLDALLRHHMRQELRDLQQRQNITTIFVTHDQDEAFEMSDRIIIMNGGLIEQVGTPEEIYDSPATKFVAGFIGQSSLVDGLVTDARGDEVSVLVDGFEVKAKSTKGNMSRGDRVSLMVRPERIEIAAPGTGVVDLQVVTRIFQGDRISFNLRSTTGQIFQCSVANSEAASRIIAGSIVGATFSECRAIRVENT